MQHSALRSLYRRSLRAASLSIEQHRSWAITYVRNTFREVGARTLQESIVHGEEELALFLLRLRQAGRPEEQISRLEQLSAGPKRRSAWKQDPFRRGKSARLGASEAASAPASAPTAASAAASTPDTAPDSARPSSPPKAPSFAHIYATNAAAKSASLAAAIANAEAVAAAEAAALLASASAPGAAPASAPASAPAAAPRFANEAWEQIQRHATGQQAQPAAPASAPASAPAGAPAIAQLLVDEPLPDRAAGGASDAAAPRASTGVRSWKVRDVEAWLHGLGLAEHAQAFARHRVDGALLLQIDEADLSDELGVASRLQRKRLLTAIRDLGSQGPVG